MRANLTPLSHYCLAAHSSSPVIAIHEGEPVCYQRFIEEVHALIPVFNAMEQEQFAIYFQQAYPFSVNLFALLHSNKKVWIAANNTRATADQLLEQGCRLLGLWQGRESGITESERNASPVDKALTLQPLDITQKQIVVFTSGSSGQAKAIAKSLVQFQNEIETLEDYWGQRLDNTQVFATVSHQHIYGLLFRVLWPLASGRRFHSDIFLSPEPLLKQAKDIKACWVASPAQLKRLDELTAWSEIRSLSAIFSSGGELTRNAADQLYQCSGQKVIEIYGSSETGGIAWRQSVNNELWSLFNGIELTVNAQQQAQLYSPYLAPETVFTLDDNIQLAGNRQFVLLGRADRLVKIEEKRLSLNELEQSLNVCPWIEQSHTLLLKGKRDKIAAALVLSESARDLLVQQGRNKLIKLIRQHLLNRFESVVLPRKWLFMQTLPYTSQAKINQQLLVELFSLESERYPQLLHCNLIENHAELELKVLSKLIYFSGHFPDQPILPGVTQLAWVEKIAKILFDIHLPFLRMEVIKFKKIIRPEQTIVMKLDWNGGNNKLYFEINSVNGSHSSGRMVYRQT